MTQQKEQTFLHCTCPHCKRPFDYVPISACECPFCRKDISRSQVWETRKYPGTLELPYWVTAFGWPVLVMLVGTAYIAFMYFTAHAIEIHGLIIGLAVMALGVIFFLYKLTTRPTKY